jgi:hypothetical protein
MIVFEIRAPHTTTGGPSLLDPNFRLVLGRTYLSIGNPDGYWQIFWTRRQRAFCLSFKHGYQTGRSACD